MSWMQGDPLPSIETTKDVETTGPEWYTDYLESLAGAGTEFVGAEGTELVPGLTDEQQALITGASTTMSGYETPLADAQSSLTGLTNIDLYGDYMSKMMDMYEQDVVDEMARQQQMNLQRYLMPTLKGGFVGSGGMGGQRYAGALGQMGADAAANLLGQQAKLRQEGFGDIMNAALKQAEIERGAASDLGTLAGIESQAAERQLKTLADLYESEREIEQQQALAPLTAAKSAADIFANLKVPSTVSETALGPIPGAYSNSPLSQIAGLGTLFAAGSGGRSAVEGFGDFIGQIPGAIRSIGELFPDSGMTITENELNDIIDAAN